MGEQRKKQILIDTNFIQRMQDSGDAYDQFLLNYEPIFIDDVELNKDQLKVHKGLMKAFDRERSQYQQSKEDKIQEVHNRTVETYNEHMRLGNIDGLSHAEEVLKMENTTHDRETRLKEDMSVQMTDSAFNMAATGIVLGVDTVAVVPDGTFQGTYDLKSLLYNTPEVEKLQQGTKFVIAGVDMLDQMSNNRELTVEQHERSVTRLQNNPPMPQKIKLRDLKQQVYESTQQAERQFEEMQNNEIQQALEETNNITTQREGWQTTRRRGGVNRGDNQIGNRQTPQNEQQGGEVQNQGWIIPEKSKNLVLDKNNKPVNMGSRPQPSKEKNNTNNQDLDDKVKKDKKGPNLDDSL
jgi:hypothetical protein